MTICKQCNTGFEIADEDRKFYKKLEVPEPTICHICRAQRRLAWRNERKFYVNESSLSGKKIVSVISPEKPSNVYDTVEWWSESYSSQNTRPNFMV